MRALLASALALAATAPFFAPTVALAEPTDITVRVIGNPFVLSPDN